MLLRSEPAWARAEEASMGSKDTKMKKTLKAVQRQLAAASAAAPLGRGGSPPDPLAADARGAAPRAHHQHPRLHTCTVMTTWAFDPGYHMLAHTCCMPCRTSLHRRWHMLVHCFLGSRYCYCWRIGAASVPGSWVAADMSARQYAARFCSCLTPLHAQLVAHGITRVVRLPSQAPPHV